MFLKIFLFFFILVNIYVHGAIKNRSNAIGNLDEKVKIVVLYECLCPYSVKFHIHGFKEVVTELGQYIDANPYPYGNAETEVDKNGNINITCQHGVKECYGNMLHACAIDILKNITDAVIFNSCLMDPSISNGMSDDSAADKCGQIYNVNSNSIKDCAKSDRGLQLLNDYGEKSRKYEYSGVPTIFINGNSCEKDDEIDNFKRTVCKVFKNPPPECSSV